MNSMTDIWKCQTETPASIYGCWFVLILSAIFNFIFGVHTIRKSLNSKYPDKLCIFIHILSICSSIFWSFHIAQSIYCISNFIEWIIIGIAGTLCYHFYLSSIFLLYLLKLQTIFNSTEYSLSKWIFILFIFAFIIQILSPFIMSYYFIFKQWSIALVFYNIFIISNCISNGLLLLVYIHKIYIVGKLMTSTNTKIGHKNSNSNSNENGKIKVKTYKITLTSNSANDLKQHQKKQEILYQQINHKISFSLKRVLTASIKCMICGFIVMISSNLLSILGVYRHMLNDSQLLWAIHLMLMVLDQSINLFFLYIQYKFGNSKYKMCCKGTHELCYNTFVKNINDKDDNIKMNIEMTTMQMHMNVNVNMESERTTETELETADNGDGISNSDVNDINIMDNKQQNEDNINCTNQIIIANAYL
eukprot:451534_1